TLNIVLVMVIGALFLPSLMGNGVQDTPPALETQPITTPAPQPLATHDTSATPQTDTPELAPTQPPTSTFPTPQPTPSITPAPTEETAPEPETVEQALARGDKKAALALLQKTLEGLAEDASDPDRAGLAEQIEDLKKQIELESFFSP
ncbi:MAG: hypothetical protein ACYTGQ_13770, partial [Planctomycetota bacterium]